jgi:hypothetical protein
MTTISETNSREAGGDTLTERADDSTVRTSVVTQLSERPKKRRSRAGLYEGDVRTTAKLASFEQRAGLVTEQMHDEVLVPLFLNRLMLRRQLAQTYNPIAFGYESLPEEFRQYLPRQPKRAELEAAKRGASKKVNNLILNLRVLGFVEADVQRRDDGSVKNKALKLYGSGSLDARNLGPAADVIHLTKEGLRYFLSRHELCEPDELDAEIRRQYEFTQVSATRIAHALTPAAIYNELRLCAALGLLEIVEFVVEKRLESEVEAVEGGLDKSKEKRKARPIPRPDVYLCVAPVGRPDLAETIYLEVDRGSQITESQRKHPLPAAANPTNLIPRKLDNYFALALRLKRALNVCFVVPEHGRVGAKVRGANLRGDMKLARDRWQVRLDAAGGTAAIRSLAHPRYEAEPTPRNFALAMAELLHGRGQGDAEGAVKKGSGKTVKALAQEAVADAQ